MSELMKCVFEYNIEEVKKLLDSGVNVNETDENGDTALHCSVCFGNLEMVELLLSKGADVDDNTIEQAKNLKDNFETMYNRFIKIDSILNRAKMESVQQQD